MDLFSNVSLNFSSVSWFTLFVMVTTITMWFWVRKKLDLIWVPILRVLSGGEDPLPKLKMSYPPIISFICFLVTALCLLFLSFNPLSQVVKPIERKVKKVHMFVDMSPSTSSVDRATLVSKLQESYDQYKLDVLTVSSSSSRGFKRPGNFDEFNHWVSLLKPHRYGLQMGEAVRAILEAQDDIDELIIASDRDQHTWSGFNWKYLLKKVVIKRIALEHQTKNNYFIDSVKSKSDISQQRVSWDVVISRSKLTASSSGTLSLFSQGKAVDSINWVIPKGEYSSAIEFNIHRGKYEEVLTKSDVLEWRLETKDTNTIQIDDVFRSKASEKIMKALLISRESGEMLLEDPMHHLVASLETLGVSIDRLNRSSQGQLPWDFPLWILDAGDGFDQTFCPEIYRKKRFSNSHKSSLPVLWILPGKTRESFRSTCYCYENLIDVSINSEKNSKSYCDNIETRDQYISVLRSTGATQIGGSLSDSLNAIAWNRKTFDKKAEVFAFTTPLIPRPNSSISFNSIPLITQYFLKLSGIIDHAAQGSVQWPRVEHGYRNEDPNLAESNVPRAESLLKMMSLKDLPPEVNSRSLDETSSYSSSSGNTDALPLIKICTWLVVAVSLVEGLWLLLKKPSFLILLLGINLVLVETDLRANVEFYGVGYNLPQSTSIRALSQDVSSRTSILMKNQAVLKKKVDDKSLLSPWLWIQSSKIIRNFTSSEMSYLRSWLARGGFLVIENYDENFLKFKDLQVMNAEWKPIPPDHEVMRSFHLLDSLPKCNELVWQGLHADGRIIAIAIPYSLFERLVSSSYRNQCGEKVGKEQSVRIFINILMVALATDYKKDQIHLPEILKRLR